MAAEPRGGSARRAPVAFPALRRVARDHRGPDERPGPRPGPFARPTGIRRLVALPPALPLRPIANLGIGTGIEVEVVRARSSGKPEASAEGALWGRAAMSYSWVFFGGLRRVPRAGVVLGRGSRHDPDPARPRPRPAARSTLELREDLPSPGDPCGASR